MGESTRPEWILSRIIDRGPGYYYRFAIDGENLNYPEAHPSRRFSWTVPNLDDPRYDTTRAYRVYWALRTMIGTVVES